MDSKKRFNIIGVNGNRVNVYDRYCKLVYSFEKENYNVFELLLEGKESKEIAQRINLDEEHVRVAEKEFEKIFNGKKSKMKLGVFYPQNRKNNCLIDLLYYVLVYISVPFSIFSVLLSMDKIRIIVKEAMNTPSFGFWGNMIVALVVSTTLHEFGHMIIARHFQCIVLEFGLKLSGFIPCGYTSIYGSNFLKSKVQRVLILSGGILVNLFLMGVSCWMINFNNTFISHVCAEFGLLNMGLAFINSLIFFEFDGYYILEEFVGKNFRIRAFDYTKKLIKRPSLFKTSSQGSLMIIYTVLTIILVPLFIISMIPNIFL